MLSLPDKQGHPVGQAQVSQGQAGPHQLRRLVLAVRVFFGVILDAGPAEVVHPAHVAQVAAHRQQAPHRLVDGHRGHVVGVDLGVGRVESQAQGQAPGRLRSLGRSTAASPGTGHARPARGLSTLAALDFVVILAGDPLPGADIGAGQHGQQHVPVILGFPQHRLLRRIPGGSHSASNSQGGNSSSRKDRSMKAQGRPW